MGEFKANPNFEKELFMQAHLVDAVTSKGEQVLSTAESLASAVSESGDFARSIKGRFSRDHKGRPHYYVYSDDEGALSIEFGTSKQTPIRALGRAIRRS